MISHSYYIFAYQKIVQVDDEGERGKATISLRFTYRAVASIGEATVRKSTLAFVFSNCGRTVGLPSDDTGFMIGLVVIRRRRFQRLVYVDHYTFRLERHSCHF